MRATHFGWPGRALVCGTLMLGWLLAATAEQTNRLDAAIPSGPVRPNWDQLMNGSLDTQLVEIRGAIESLLNRKNGWTRVDLRTRDGVLRIELRRSGVNPSPLEQFEDAVIRVRGKLIVDRNAETGRVKSGQIRMYAADILVDQPAPEDLFSIPTKTAASLVRSDPEYDPFRRVKVMGQIVFVRGGDYFMMDGADGLRFSLKRPAALGAGDLVEVVGFPDVMSAAAPVLRGAVARKTGQAALPMPKRLVPEDLIRPALDSTRVQVDGVLQNLRSTPTNLVMEMQAGNWRFLARLAADSASLQSLPLGSRLDLTGVYCAQGGYKALGEDVAAVDLLLQSSADIKVLSRPSWWTLQRLLVVMGALAGVLVMAVLWITQLHRQVRQRGAELEVQIQERQRVEHQRAMEQERTRIARDLHDELGSGITEIGMLAARAKSASALEENRRQYVEQMGDKAREIVTALDEIVWAMNPRHDSLASLVSYFCLYADRFLGLANIAWKLESPVDPPECLLNSQQRHQLFLAFKEALTNVVRHSGATEVRLNILFEQGELRLSIADNGLGFPASERTTDMSGVANMRARIEKLGGRFELSGEAGRGVSLRFSVPVN